MRDFLIAEAATESPKEFNFPARQNDTFFHQRLVGSRRPGRASHRSLDERRANLLHTNRARPETDARAIIDRSQTSIARPPRGTAWSSGLAMQTLRAPAPSGLLPSDRSLAACRTPDANCISPCR